LKKESCPTLDEFGMIKIGSEVRGNDILVGKLTPDIIVNEQTEAELLLSSIISSAIDEESKKQEGQEKTKEEKELEDLTSNKKFLNSSLFLPSGERGVVYDVKRKELKTKKNELELIEIYVAQERKIEVGDKLTTRFGNKGVVAKIVREEDMPFDSNGETVDIIFNPLGIPSRMNVGQLLETILASAAKKTGKNLLVRPFNTPSLEQIKEIINEADIKDYGNQIFFDGKTGLPFDQKIYNGYIYVIKLNHMVTDKIHARNTGPCSLIYQQPLKGRAQEGGQRVGEMEAWALEAHGAPYNLMEMMSAKSDDIRKRRSLQSSMIFKEFDVDLRSSQSESFNLLLQYL
jgi:DNA-directed RNA polymerase subunit beta